MEIIFRDSHIKKTMFCVFIDFEKAFDTVWREGLRCKLLMNHINGKMHIVIVNMYHNVKSRITYENESEHCFLFQG
jgi:hypothetical protein